jgi:DNA polymerase III alpha subunit
MLMKTDSLGVPRFTDRDLIDIIYSGNLEKCHVVLCEPSDDVEKFNQVSEELGLPTLTKYVPVDVDKSMFDDVCRNTWYMPEKYKNINLSDYFLERVMEETQCPDDVYIIDRSPEWERVRQELNAFVKHEITDVLRYMIYLVDFMIENNIVWGVGRGSSVSSYLLYLIGVHKINSIKYNLDWREFLK